LVGLPPYFFPENGYMLRRRYAQPHNVAFDSDQRDCQVNVRHHNAFANLAT
jgi:hypothetical protein